MSSDAAVRPHANLKFSLVAAIIGIQILALLLPRTPVFMSVVYASPVLTSALLLALGAFSIRLGLLLAYALIFAVSLAISLFTSANALNVVLSFASYSSVALLLLVWRGSAQQRDKLLATYWFWLTCVAIVLVGIGVFQLIEFGFPFRLPYRDFSPDIFDGPYGDGGHRLIPMVLAPLLFRIGSKVLVTKRVSASDVVLGAILLFGFVAPGSNATILALFLAIFCYVAAQVAIGIAKRTQWNLRSFMIALGAFAVLSGSITAVFSTVGSVYHTVTSLTAMNPMAIQEGSNPKVRAMVETVVELPAVAPAQPLIGVGLGNYSSWSQLLLSGVYAERFLPGRGLPEWVPVSITPEAWQFVLRHISPEMYERYGRWYAESVSTLPWSSWQSIYAELGVIGLLLVGMALVPVFQRLTVSRFDSESYRVLKLTLGLSLWFVAACSLIDNYFEYPWLMVPALLPVAFLGRRRKL